MQPMRLARLFGVDAQLLHDQVASKAAGILDENNANAIGLDAVEQPVEALPTLDQIGAADRGVAIPVFIGEGALKNDLEQPSSWLDYWQWPHWRAALAH